MGRLVHPRNRLLLHLEDGWPAVFCSKPGMGLLGAVDLRGSDALDYQCVPLALANPSSAIGRHGTGRFSDLFQDGFPPSFTRTLRRKTVVDISGNRRRLRTFPHPDVQRGIDSLALLGRRWSGPSPWPRSAATSPFDLGIPGSIHLGV